MKVSVFQNLPDISIKDRISEANTDYIHLEKDFDPFESIATTSEKLISFSEIIAKKQLPSQAPIAIISHLLDFASTEHKHDYIEIVYLLNGKIFNILNRTPFTMEAGDLVMIPAQTPHLLAPHPESQEMSQVVNILVRQDLFTTYMTNAISDYDFLTSPPAHLFTQQEQIPEQVIHHLIVEYKAANFQMSMAVLGRLLLLFQVLKDGYQSYDTTQDPLTEQVITYIENQKGLCQLGTISQALAYSDAHISRHIKKQTGKTVAEWITKAKLTNAQSLLLETDLPISQIALQSGYQSESHFFRLFKQEFGMTPKQYKDLMK